MKPLLAAVAGAVLLLTGGTIWIGSRAREETVVAHPYEEGLAYDAQRRALHAAAHARPPPATAANPECDLGAGPCTRALGDLELTLEVAPRPPRAMTELAVRGRLARAGEPVDGGEVVISFAMSGMSMGENLSRLAGAGGGRYQGRAILVRCHSGRRDWVATAVVRLAGEERRAAYALRLSE